MIETTQVKLPTQPDHRAAGGPAVSAVARGGIANLAGAVLAAAAGVGVTWLVARGLGPVAAGSFFAATSAFVLIGGIARLGTVTALVYWPARLRAQGRPELIGACLRAGLIPVAVLSTLLGVALWFAAPVLFPHYASPLRALALFMPFAALGDALLATTRGYRMMRPTVYLDKIVRPALQLVGVGGLALLVFLEDGSFPAFSWAFAWVVPYLPVVVCAALLVWRRWSAEPKVDGPAEIEGLPVGRAFWRFTAPRALANAAQTALQRVDVMMVASLAGLAAAAAYAVAGRFVVVGQLANGAISQAVQPRLAEALALGDKSAAGKLYQSATAWLILISWPLHLTIFTYADVYLGVFGKSYVHAAPAVRVLAVAMLIGTGCGMVDIMLSMAGRTTWNLVNVMVALGAMVVADLITIPRLGALGAAVGLATAVVVNNILPLAQLVNSLGLHPFGFATRLSMALCGVSFGLVPGLIRWVAPVNVATQAGALLVGLLAYLVGLRQLRRPLGLSKALWRK